jgi:hypothetical protein
VREFLDNIYSERWVDAMASSLPRYNPHVKERVLCSTVTNLNELCIGITDAVDLLTPQMQEDTWHETFCGPQVVLVEKLFERFVQTQKTSS